MGKWQLNRLAQAPRPHAVLAARLALPPFPVSRDLTADSARQRRVVAQGSTSSPPSAPARTKFQWTPGVALVSRSVGRRSAVLVGSRLGALA